MLQKTKRVSPKTIGATFLAAGFAWGLPSLIFGAFEGAVFGFCMFLVPFGLIMLFMPFAEDRKRDS